MKHRLVRRKFAMGRMAFIMESILFLILGNKSRQVFSGDQICFILSLPQNCSRFLDVTLRVDLKLDRRW